ncbi:MAG: DUF2332 domain-containing protein [Novosphingobium sp.]|nr:DUF2332 domain-containing protein [Novosphingobium sp.]
MSEEHYRQQTLYQTGGSAVADAFHNQSLYCRTNDALITARIVEGVRDLLASDAPGELLARVRGWSGAPLADALPLRVAGGLHAIHLKGEEPALSAIYRGGMADVAAVLGDVVARRDAELLPWLDGPPQTNEAGRSSNFILAMLWLAERGLGPRFECLEIGSSAGINLMIDRYRYDLGGVEVGPADAALTFKPEWRGPPPPDRHIEFASLKGCDVAPVDLTDPEQAVRLKAYIWPEHHVRFARMDLAIAAASERKPDIVRMNAAEFVEQALAAPQAAGTTRVLMHSIVWQYVPVEQQTRVSAAMEAAGERATPERPLAWIALEANRTVHYHELTVRYWPGGERRLQLGVAHAHGAWLEYFAEPLPSAWPG